MGFLEDFNKSIAKQDRNMRRAVVKQDRGLKKSMAQQDKAVKKAMNIKIKGIISKEGRVRIPAKRRHEVEDKYHNKCAKCPNEKPLQIHHINGNNRDNRLKNLILLCANCHYKIHSKGSKINKIIRKRSQKNNSFWG